MAKPTKLLVVTVPAGLIIRDTPRPESKGGKALRKVGVGAQLYAYQIHYFDDVAYARLEPLNPARPEWVRVAEADGMKYADVIDLEEGDSTAALANAVTLLATAVTLLATEFRAWARGESK